MIKNNIEKIKTIVLWILILSSIALVAIRYNLIGYFDLSQANMKLINSDKIFAEVIIPRDFIIKFDKFNITKIEDNKSQDYRQIKQYLKSVLIEKNSIKKIDKSKYDEYKENSGIQLSYDDIPSVYIEDSMDIHKSNISDLGYIQEIYIILEKDTILIKTTEDFFVLKSNKNAKFEFVEKLSSTNYPKYYPILENVNKNPHILFPLKSSLKMSDYNTASIFEEHKISDIAENIFKEKFDFTASFIQKNGVYFYSHNNGQEILKVDMDGNFEYKNNQSDNAQTDFTKSTKIMLMFLMDLEIKFSDIMINSVKKIETPKGIVYDFEINSRINDIPVYIKDSSYGHIQVLGNTVSSCKFYLRYKNEKINSEKNIMEASKALNDNIKIIMAKMEIKDVEKALSLVNDVQLVYAFDRDKILRASWKFDINKNIFIIDASTGEIIENGMVES